MRLRELDAHFVGEWDEKSYRMLDSVEGAQGLLFQCPKCAVGLEAVLPPSGRGFVRGAHYVLCWFRNPRNAPRVPDSAFPNPGRWTFEGETIDVITFVSGNPPMSFSVLITPPEKPEPGFKHCDWHGFIRNGEATLS